MHRRHGACALIWPLWVSTHHIRLQLMFHRWRRNFQDIRVCWRVRIWEGARHVMDNVNED